MPSQQPEQFTDLFDLVAIMCTGVDPMESFDKSIPLDPATYRPHEHFKNRISLDDARSVGIGDACENFEKNRHQLICLAHLPTEAFLYALRFQKLREEVKNGRVLQDGGFCIPDDPPASLWSALSKSLRDCVEGKREFPWLCRKRPAEPGEPPNVLLVV